MPKKILIVDDEPMMLKLAERILKSSYETVCASSGKEALALFSAVRPDMVLSDVHMPGMDGYELQRSLQEKSATPVPVMFMTTDESESSESRGFEVGAADYVRKPLKEEVLLRRIDNILKNVEKIRDLKKAADIDPLTKLLNKGAARRETEKLVKSVPGCLLMVDLDSFKSVNDVYGHAMGDAILVRFAVLLKSITRFDDCVGRVGGDEFMVFLRKVQTGDVISQKINYLNEELLHSACEYMGDDMAIPFGVSVGGAFTPQEGNDFAELSKKADRALYTVKQNGKHGIAFFDSRQKKEEAPNRQNLAAVRRILAEREPPKRAFLVSAESFTVVYRSYLRQEGDKPRQKIWQITLRSKKTNMVEEEPLHRLEEILLSALDVGDCVTRYGKGQFLALTDNDNDTVAQILTAWQTSPFSDEYSVGFDSENL